MLIYWRLPSSCSILSMLWWILALKLAPEAQHDRLSQLHPCTCPLPLRDCWPGAYISVGGGSDLRIGHDPLSGSHPFMAGRRGCLVSKPKVRCSCLDEFLLPRETAGILRCQHNR